MLVKVTLNAIGGGFAAHVKILPFSTPPDVIVWGSRFFLDTSAVDDDGCPIYAEAFTAFALPEQYAESL